MQNKLRFDLKKLILSPGWKHRREMRGDGRITTAVIFRNRSRWSESCGSALDMHQKIEETTNPEERWKLQRQVGDLVGGLVPGDAKMPTEIIKRQLEEIKGRMKTAQEGAASQFAQAEEYTETIKYVQSAETYALQEAYDSYAQVGISAMRQSKKMEDIGKLKKPIAIAMENLWYGAVRLAS